MIYIGSDHGGYKQKEALKKFLFAHKQRFIDLGPHLEIKDDDYPIYAAKVARAVQKNKTAHKGILLCRSGQGVCFAANKFKKIRAVVVWNVKIAEETRRDNDANILCLPSDFVSNSQAAAIVALWLKTKFSKLSRHRRRIRQVENLK